MAEEDALYAFQHECGVCVKWDNDDYDDQMGIQLWNKSGRGSNGTMMIMSAEDNNVAGPSVVNMVEHNNSYRYNDNKGKRKHHDTRANLNKKPKVTCWKCGKPGHLKRIARLVMLATEPMDQAQRDQKMDDDVACGVELLEHLWHEAKIDAEAINDDMDSIMGNNTWVLTHLPTGCRPLGCKWIFKRKLKVDGTVEKFKARLVIQGFKQNFLEWGIGRGGLYEPTSRLHLTWQRKQADKCVYSKFDASGKGVIICLYVDDMLIFGTDQVQVDSTKEFLSSRFSFFLSTLSEGHGGGRCYPGPDIAFAVGKLSRYTSNPGTQHWQAIQRVLKYLKKTMDYSVGRKQTCITNSTIEYEFVTLAAAGKEAEWLNNLLLEISMWVKPMAHISIRCDSAATLAKAYSQMYNGKSKHLGVRHSMIRS
ncbi:zinc finger, CCHC-type containing protein [Tanacetum coccineum]